MDWNNDGYTDILVGERYGYVHFFERNSDGTLKAGVRLKDNNKIIDVGGNSSPDFVDWDNDGDLDMILGSDLETPVRIYENTGTAASYKFNGYTEFRGGGSVAKWYRSMPTVYDMNNDGLFDIVIGAYDKKFHYYENTGTAGSPSFAASTPLRYDNGAIVRTVNIDSRLDINDWNEDGLPDIIAGDYELNVYLILAHNDASGVAEGPVVPSALEMISNPVRSNLAVSINLGEAAVSDITVYNMDGRVVLTHTTLPLEPGYNTVQIQENLPNGTYVLQCTAGNRSLTERFAVVR